ncbi:probable arginine--tRNA ligase, mitochondrial [Dreissena polymorpha]|nr:probable arginine--tRNA ligase, mitochondrial [Dreissena polymorpha]
MKLTYCLRKFLSQHHVVRHIRKCGPSYGFGDESNRLENAKHKVVVEYSSPNIAKPFHMGHLRSTILGNFLATLYERLGWNVIRLNYLGDWGTQFGVLAVAFKKYGDEEKLKENPLQHLFDIYVNINKEKSLGNKEIDKAALEMFKRMESGDPEALSMWQRLKDISLQEYDKMYERLGVKFTEQHSESMYKDAGVSVIDRLKKEGLFQKDDMGKGYVEFKTGAKTIPVVVLKSDGTSLYITREIAALTDRFERYRFEKIHYVVENGQHLHFEHMYGVINTLPEYRDRLNADLHVKFGRVEGMSTRQGNVVFLKDILDEARNRMTQTLKTKSTTRVGPGEIAGTAEELGRSAIFAQDLSQQRLKPYAFDWDRVLNFNQDSGVFLQYCHSRLCSIERMNSEVAILEEMVLEDEHYSVQQAADLINHLQEYEQAVERSFSTLEPYVIVRYLYALCHKVNAAYKVCRVKEAQDAQLQAYLQMFNASRVVLSSGMELLGLHPLEKM